MQIENKIELLWQGAKTLENEQHTHKLLKSYYINTCRKLAKNNLQVPKEKFAISQMCPYCGNFWSESEYGLKLIPKQFKSTSKAIRLVENYENRHVTTSKALNKKQRNRAKWLKKKMYNHLEIKCFQCRHLSFIKMGNQKNKSLEKLTKDNKLKDPSTVVSRNSSGNCNIPLKYGSDGKRGQESKILSSVPIKSKKEKHENHSNKISKSKNKKTNPNNIASKTVISKTQKQNSLLQLAALLQKQSKVGLKNSAQKQLQSFLK